MEDELRELIENYQANSKKMDKLQTKLKDLLDYNTKVTATYGPNTGGGKGSISSKVENYVIKICETEQQIKKLGNKLAIVDNAQKILTNKENEVIDLIKDGYRNKLTKIAKLIGKDKKYVFDIRNRAIKKMSEYIKG